MPDEELTLILRLRDEATKQMKSARGAIVAAGAAIGAAGFAAGKKWDDATKTIVSGTGATGKALKGLQKDYQAVAKYGDGAATVIADLNTHLGLEGKALQDVAEAALKAKVDTNLFGDVASQLGLDAQGAAAFLDDLTVASQGTGVDIDMMTRTIGRSSARWLAAGGDMDGLTATVIKAADEFGPSGLRGAMSEILQEVDKGLIPSFESLDSQLGDTTGAVERTYEASKTWRDTLRETKDAALAYIGPAGDMLGAIGSTASGLALAGPQMLQWIKGTKLATIAQKAFNLAMRLNPIGLIVTALVLAGLAIWKFRDEIKEGFGQVVRFAKNLYMGVKTWLTDKLGAIFDGMKAKVDAVTGFFKNMKDKVVGNSIVPDMVDEVGSEFRRMGGVMTTETQGGVSRVAGLFSNFFGPSGEFSLTTIMDGAKGLFQNALTNTLNMVPVVGPLLSQFAPALMAGIGKLAGKVWGSIKSLFGGPDGMEQEGRRAASAARDAISATLTDGQITEAAGDAAAAVHIAIRDATLLAGKSLAEAEVAASHWVAALHRAEKEGGGAVDGVKRKILDLLKPQQQVVDGTKDITSAFIASEQAIKHTHAQTMADMEAATKASVAAQIMSFGQLSGAAGGGGGGTRADGRSLADFLRDNPGDAHRYVEAGRNVTQGRAEDPNNPGHSATAYTGSDAVYSRARGGPVRAGRPYMVGERGPEMFVPGRSGGIVPNSIAKEIGAAVAAALHRVPLRVSRNSVTDAMLENAPRRQALHGTA